MEKLMSNSDLIWMSKDDIFTHEETSKPYLVSHKWSLSQSGVLQFLNEPRYIKGLSTYVWLTLFHLTYLILFEAHLFNRAADSAYLSTNFA